MRTVLTRLAALGVMTAALAGCSGGGSTALPISGQLNGTGGSNGVNTGNTSGAGAVTTAGTVTTVQNVPPTGGSLVFPGPAGYAVTVITGGSGFATSGTAPTTLSGALSIAPPTGVTPFLPAVGGNALFYTRLVFTPPAGTTLPATPTNLALSVMLPAGLLIPTGRTVTVGVLGTTGTFVASGSGLFNNGSVIFPSVAVNISAPVTLVFYY